jgi:peptide-methionine (S)-S-oxide reductase
MNLNIKFIILTIIVAGFFTSCARANKVKKNVKSNYMDTTVKDMDTITLAAGCFWCTEAVFQRLKGVDTVISGYTGGTVKNPSYKEVCNGTTGHAEAIQVIYNKNVISLTELLHVFFKTHDPTTLDYQGNDHGTQYRSGIFYHNESQKKIAEEVIRELNEQKVFDSPVVTEVTAFTNFYNAEDYHQNFYNDNPEYGYCRAVINPKIEKLEKYFKDKMK